MELPSFRVLVVVYVTCVLFMIMSEPMLETVAQLGRPGLWATLEEERVSLEELAALNESVCSARATKRGPGQRVVAFSFYGDRSHWRGYFRGLEDNARIMPQYYPNWTMRVYHGMAAEDQRVPERERGLILQRLREWEATYPHLDLCDVTRLPLHGRFEEGQQNAWRFVPMVDPLVEVVLFRDADSRLSPREAAAVDEWLQSGLSFHVMRDHPYHGYAILAGMWGVRRDLEPELILKIGNKLQRSMLTRNVKEEDQKLLRYFVWPEIKGKVLQHDSFFCMSYFYLRHGNMRPWPTQRHENGDVTFVGCIEAVVDKKMPPCPRTCRPIMHQNWTMC